MTETFEIYYLLGKIRGTLRSEQKNIITAEKALEHIREDIEEYKKKQEEA